MPADSLWILAMAFNVYLTFFRKYNAQQLRALEWKYMIFCYGLPFLPAFAYFFVQTPSRGKVYGSATVRSHPWKPTMVLISSSSYGVGFLLIGISCGSPRSTAQSGWSSRSPSLSISGRARRSSPNAVRFEISPMLPVMPHFLSFRIRSSVPSSP